MTPGGWKAVLDALDERVERHREVLFGKSAAPRFDLPKDLGPLPLELVGRACAILVRQRQLEEEISAHMELLSNLFERTPPVPLYLDKSA